MAQMAQDLRAFVDRFLQFYGQLCRRWPFGGCATLWNAIHENAKPGE